MAIYLTPEGGRRMKFPMLPEEVNISMGSKSMTYQIIALGDIQIPRGRSCTKVSWSGMLPGKKRRKDPYVKGKLTPKEVVKRLKRHLYEGTRCQLVVGDTSINMAVNITSFKGHYSGGHGDFYYDIEFTEAREITIRSNKDKKKTRSRERSRKSKITLVNDETISYAVKPGDSLWRIAQSVLGDGSRYGEIYKLNRSVIDKHGKGPNTIIAGDVLTIPMRG